MTQTVMTDSADMFTVVVPFYGPISLIEPLLRALDQQTAAELPRVLVSDDASPQPIDQAVRDLGLDRLDVEVIRSEHNGGPGAARNRAIAEVASEWVAFLDGDLVPAPDWVERLVALIARTDADVVEGVSNMPDDDIVTPFTHSTETSPPDRHGAGNVAMRTDLIRSIGGFDERFFDTERKVHFREDADVTFRLEATGAVYDFDPELIVVHPPLEPSFWTPIRLARRYYFDPLLSKLHPQSFANMHTIRKVGPISLRAARHYAATGFVIGTVLTVWGIASGNRRALQIGLVLGGIGWVGNIGALCYNRTVKPEHVVPVAAAAGISAFSYVWNFWRGVIEFRHHPHLWR